MRISDWSSDVCSSDLGLDQPIADFLPAFAKMTVQDTPDGSITAVHPAKTPITVRQLLTHTAGLGYNIIQTGPLREAYNKAGLIDRKSVVEGKRVSVRVDLGGRRIIKKKEKRTRTQSPRNNQN